MKKLCGDRVALTAVIIAVIFAISLIPILAASFYSHPVGDDLGYAAEVHHAVNNGGGFWTILKTAASEAVRQYDSWQGTFAAIFVFALQPGAFADNLYFLTTFILLGALTASTIFLIQTIVVRWLGQKKSHMLLISLVTLFVQIQFVPNIAEAFFWFNGASYYTLFYTFAQVLAAILIRLYTAKSKRDRIMFTFLSTLLAVIIGGGNYSTGLFSACAMGTALFVSAMHKRPESKNLAVVFAVLLLAFGISVAAPGNAVRAAVSNYDQMSPAAAVFLSLYSAAKLLGKYVSIGQMTAFAFILPLIYMSAKKCKWTFKYPLLAIVLAFGLFACQLTPPIYAMEGDIGAGRQQNIYYYSSVLMVLFDLFYISGWINTGYPDAISIESIKAIFCKHTIPILLAFAVLFSLGCLNYDIGRMTSPVCAVSILNGKAKEYDETVSDNIAKMEAARGVCYVRNVENVPPIFLPLDISTDGTYWVNYFYSQFYDCESVIALN